jgi:predicted secreted protein
MTEACIPPEELVGFGALLQYYDVIATQWTTVGGTKDLDFPEDATGKIDTTSNDSDGGYKTNIPSPLSELGETSYSMNFRWSQWSTLVSIKANKTILNWRIVLMNPQQTYMEFCAWIMTIAGSVPMEDLVTGEITLSPTGAPEWGQLL